MKKLYLTVIYLFCFQSGAMEADLCKALFERAGGESINYNGLSAYLLRRDNLEESGKLPFFYHREDVSPQILVDFLPYTISVNALSGKGQLLREWKEQVLKNLEQIDKAQLLTLFHNLAVLKDKLYLEKEQAFFWNLAQASIKYIPEFNKEQLVDIVWIFSQLEMKNPGEKFVQTWRESAFKIRREFSSMDRYSLTDIFKKLSIQPVNNSQ